MSYLAQPEPLLARLRAFCFPGGEEAARRVRAVKTTQRGEFRMSPDAEWIPFTAEETIEAGRSAFRWDARLKTGKLGFLAVTDAYEEGCGWIEVKLGGILPVRRIDGPDADKGELQRYLASVVFCPAMALNHPSLEWMTVELTHPSQKQARVGHPRTLRVRDRLDPTGATVDFELGEDGRPLVCRADRPRLVGEHSVLTPWSGVSGEFREWEGLRVASRLEVSWHLPEGPFVYFRGELTSFTAIPIE